MSDSGAVTRAGNNFGAARRGASVRQDRLQTLVFTAAIFLSAFLLFSVQPMFSKMVLPKLGGAPSVWAISMCFFQAVLLAGYCYAHVINSRLRPWHASLAHLLLLALTALALPIGLPADLSEPPVGDAYLWTLGVLALGVGLPFFAVSANAPLLQAWFSRSEHPAARDPYFLYAASNVGSLLALLAYPVVIEPWLSTQAQAWSWSLGFLLLGLLIAASAMSLPGLKALMAPSRESSAGAAVAGGPPTVILPLTWHQRAIWCLLSFFPSGMVVAVTTYLSTDVAAAPFLWVVPLALFLVTFIVVFRETLPFSYGILHWMLPVAAVVLVLTEASGAWQTVALLAALVGFFVASLICHRELYLRRPATAHLTAFYIWMSVGGVLGGIFSALLAPQIFNAALEFKLLLLGALVFRPGILLDRESPLDSRRLGVIAFAVLGLFVGYGIMRGTLPSAAIEVAPYVLALFMIGGLVAIRNWAEHRLAMVIVAVLAVTFKPGESGTLHSVRSFFGTHRVALQDNGAVRVLLHGTTIHGLERITTAGAMPVPATYYHAEAPMARALRMLRDQHQGRPLSVAVVGLGTGSMACHLAPGDRIAYYEIDPAVVGIAKDPSLFSFLQRCAPDAPIIVGDARLTLAKAQVGALDYLVIDAFSSDAIPVHLMTVEAIDMYMARIKHDGVVALHVSNRHLNLEPSLAATLDMRGLVHRQVVRWKPAAGDVDAAESIVVLIAKQPGVLVGVQHWSGAAPMPAGRASAWTDDYSDIVSTLFAR